MSLVAVVAVAVAGCERRADLGPVADTRSAVEMRRALVDVTDADLADAVGPVGTGWATIRGRFVYAGDAVPQMPPYNVTREHNICTINGRPPLQETLLVDSASRGIKNVAVFLRDATRVHDSAEPRDEPVVFDQEHCVFLTHVLSVTVGETIDIRNSDPTGHNTNILGTGFNQTIPEGGSIPFRVQRELAQPAQVVCSIHPWMVAYILPRRNGYHAVTDEEGRFEIANVPAGEPLEFQVWHESGAAPANGLVGATPEAPDVKWTNRGRVTLTLQPDEVKEIEVIVQPGAFRG